MATDPLDSVISNVPDWHKRLEELNSQIEQRQRDLAKFSGAEPPSSSARSIRNRGSMESLKPQDDGPSLPTPDPDPTTDQMPKPIVTAIPPQTPNGQTRPNGPQPPSTPASDPWTGSSLVRHTNELVATAQRRARATVRKRQKTDSMISGDGGPPKYRSRRMVMVYYDSYVQSFFEELVKFVSAQRNLMRKAKMAAKVAHIRRLAELEMPEDDEDDGGEMRLQYLSSRNYGGALRSPALGFMPGRGMRTSALNGSLGVFNEKGDVWDELDKGLESVQGLCERAAHQFLRDGDCNEEIEKIKSRLVKVKELAIKEKERTSAEQAKNETETESKPEAKPEPRPDAKIESQPEPTIESQPDPKPESKPEVQNEGVLEPEIILIRDSRLEMPEQKDELVPEVTRNAAPETGPFRPRTFRPSTMRRDIGASNPSKFPAREGLLEIDEGIDVDMDDFKPVYRSTRLMRRPV
ncbi:hypothetical protein F5Y07DRAFT_388488 [Xylaria sp. FL0933]|nr:hypothetical protein F5Y07DRAFT_388488 [Xylaria sp. FL0933]